MFLAVTAALFSIPIAIALGVVAALYRESVFDKIISILTLAAVSTPAAASAKGTVLKGGVRKPVTGESAPAKPVSVPTTGIARWAD